jgi:hypothetical protein
MVLAASPSPNASAFFQAITDFNSQNWADLETLLDPKVVLFTIKRNETVRGIDSVMHYLKNNVATDQEQFIPDLSKIVWPSQTIVTGRAIWVDADGPAGCGSAAPTSPPCGMISYFFRFTNANQIDRMYGSPD